MLGLDTDTLHEDQGIALRLTEHLHKYLQIARQHGNCIDSENWVAFL